MLEINLHQRVVTSIQLQEIQEEEEEEEEEENDEDDMTFMKLLTAPL